MTNHHSKRTMKSFNRFINEATFTDYEFGLHIAKAQFDKNGNMTSYTAKTEIDGKVISGPEWDRLASDVAKHLGIKNIAGDFKLNPNDKTIMYTEVEKNIGGQYFVSVEGKRFVVPQSVERI